MSRRHKLQLRLGKALYKEVCQQGAEAFGEGRYKDALSIYEQFAQEHPHTHAEELQLKLRALKEYIEDRNAHFSDASHSSAPS